MLGAYSPHPQGWPRVQGPLEVLPVHTGMVRSPGACGTAPRTCGDDPGLVGAIQSRLRVGGGSEPPPSRGLRRVWHDRPGVECGLGRRAAAWCYGSCSSRRPPARRGRWPHGARRCGHPGHGVRADGSARVPAPRWPGSGRGGSGGAADRMARGWPGGVVTHERPPPLREGGRKAIRWRQRRRPTGRRPGWAPCHRMASVTRGAGIDAPALPGKHERPPQPRRAAATRSAGS